jgi:glycosyltransferase involved in cell wall biosynthesis
MVDFCPVAVVIPTYNRGTTVLSTLRRIYSCDPRPAEVWVHVDAADGILEAELANQFPEVGVLTSPIRLGPGGGRHRCLLACKAPYAASFDDDSYPKDVDFFYRVAQLFSQHPRAGVIGASIWHRHEAPKVRVESLRQMPSFTGCGHAIRLAAYRQLRGYLPRPVAYGMEESDVSLQMFAAHWQIFEAGDLRVFHDTELKHHQSPEITSGYVTNIGLFAFLNYPVIGWGWGLLQLANVIAFSIRMGRIRGLWSGILSIPAECYRNRQRRNPIAWSTVRSFLRFRRTGLGEIVDCHVD